MSQFEKFTLGVIGTGKMGAYHLEKFLTQVTCAVSGVYDSDPLRAKATAEKYQTRYFNNLDDLLFESDAVVVASSTPTHYPIVKQALRSGVHVLVEKPLALSSIEARELAALAQENGLVLQVGFVERYRLNELLKNVTLSRVKQIECERITESVGREPGVDVVTDLMIHDLDLILSLKLGALKSVRAKGSKVLHETLDIAVADLTFDSGASVHLIANRLGPQSSRKMRILMDESYCKVDLNHSKVTLVQKSGSRTYDSDKGKDFLSEQAKGFCAAVCRQTVPLVSAEQGTSSIELVEKILATIQENSSIKDESSLIVGRS